MILKKKTPRQHDLPENISNFTMRDYVISMFNDYKNPAGTGYHL
jgi:hypothetical protein